MAGQKVNVYFDGFNFYNGLRDKRWKQFYWLDVVKFSEKIIEKLDSKHKLKKAYYFSAPPHKHTSKEKRQKRFFSANALNSKFELVMGYHKDKSKYCSQCNCKIAMSEEKQTDVNIALTMLKNAVRNNCNLSILISGDTDMIPVISAIKEVNPSHMVMLFFPPKRKTHQMRNLVDGWRELDDYKITFSESLLPDDCSGIIIPQKWKNFQV